ncbi:MAG TPA: maleylpyruvate isomerase family mycothiol-dependent enzyme [Acidimicrobiia bacterium]|jgi:uncharacterized protein (TIGR03083 family)|nr:maleylpyruvate isomerase family mycothiol-dependent enzyme [Acidimicrobiia bacterium]
MPESEFSQAQAAVRRVGYALAQLIDTAPDASARLPNSEWTVRELAVHVTLGTEMYGRFANGETEPFVDLSDIAGGSLARTTAARLDDEPEQDLHVLAKRLQAAIDSLIASCASRSESDPAVWNGVQTDLRAMLGLALGECLVHGYDLASFLDRSWPLEKSDARLILASALAMLPLLVNPKTSAGVNVDYDLRVRGGTRVTLRINDGKVTTDEPGAKVECHVSAHPVALLLVAYGRQTQWVPMLTGKLLAWGRKPWLGLKLTSYLVAP